jgi:hypothetical protein
MAKIVLKRNGTVTHRESKTFDRKAQARSWMAQREAEIAHRGLPSSLTLGDAIDRYSAESLRQAGKTKVQVLRSIRTHRIASLPCSAISSRVLIDFARDLLRRHNPLPLPTPADLWHPAAGPRTHLASPVVVHELELPDVAMLLHHPQELDHHLGHGPHQDL